MPISTPISRFLFLACFIFVCHLKPAGGEDWTQFRGANFGRTTETNLPVVWNADKVVWKTPLSGRGSSSPVLFDGRIYLTYYTGYHAGEGEATDPKELKRTLLCVDQKNGEVIWSKTIPSTSGKNPYNDWGVALHGYASSSAAVDESGVYVFLGATGAMAFDHDGTHRWTADCGTKTHAFGTGTSPVLYADKVIINASVESGDLIALNKADGSVAWRQPGLVQSWSLPILYKTTTGETELAVSVQNKILAFDPDTGSPLWSCDSIEDYICPSIIVQDGILFATGGRQGKTVAVRSGGRGDVTATHKLWDLGKGSNVSSPVFHDGYLYWAKEKTGIVYCANARTGELVYEERLEPTCKLIYASAFLADGKIYYVSRDDGAYVVAAKPEFELLAHNTLEGDRSVFNASPVPIETGLLLRSDKYLYLIGE